MHTTTAEQSALTESHRLACEVRYALAMPLAERRAYLALVAERRGEAGAQYLRDAVRAEWEQRKAIRVAALGKTGSVSGLLKTLGSMSPDERKERGPLINGLRDRVAAAITARSPPASSGTSNPLGAARVTAPARRAFGSPRPGGRHRRPRGRRPPPCTTRLPPARPIRAGGGRRGRAGSPG